MLGREPPLMAGLRLNQRPILTRAKAVVAARQRTERGKSGCWSLPDRMGILTDPVRQVTMALGMMRGVVDALARLRS